MPELPEVETVRVGLARLLPGKVVRAVTHDTDKSFPNAPADVRVFLIGAEIRTVKRRAKVLLVELSTEYSLVIHLKMTGQLVFSSATVHFGAGHPSDSLIGHLPDKSTRVELTFTDGSKLFFNDQRKFGWMKLYPTAVLHEALTGSVLEPNARKGRSAEQAVHVVPRASTGALDAAVGQELTQSAGLGLAAGVSGTDAVIDFMKRVGPEPLEADFTWQVMRDRLQRRKNTNIKAAILDQSVIAGVGNIYADESLWGAKIHPTTLVRAVSDTKIKALHRALVDVLNLSIAKGGSSSHTYVNAEGKKGSYLDFANVFRREGQTCPRCGTLIEKTRVAGRGTHICPHCQKPRY